MDDIKCVKNLLDKWDFMCKLDLKDAYLPIPIHQALFASGGKATFINTQLYHLG